MTSRPSTLRSWLRWTRGEERGVALPLAILVALILAGLIVTLAQMTSAELEIEQRTFWDIRAQYLAQAAIEHQIYLLKGNKNAGALALTNYPITPGREYWYRTTLTCLLNCTTNRESRRWRIIGTGEIRRPGTSTVLQNRAIRAVVEIAYSGTGADLYRFPTAVIILRWEEVYP